MTSEVQEEAQEARKKAKIFRIKFVDPASGWDRDSFIGAFKQYKDIKEDYEKFQKNNNDYDAWESLAGRLYGTGPDDYSYMRDPEVRAVDVAAEIDTVITHATDNIDRYVYNNRGRLLDLLEEDENKKPEKDRKVFRDLVISSPFLFNTKSGKEEHDDLVDIVRGYQQMVRIARAEDPQERTQGMRDAVATAVLKESDDDPFVQRMLSYSLGRQRWVETQFSKIIRAEDAAVKKVLTPKRAKELIMKNMEMAEEEYLDETYDAGDQKDLRDVWKVLLDQVAPRVYKICKAEKDAEKDRDIPAKHDDNVQAAERRARGFPK